MRRRASPKVRLGLFASHEGTNLQRILNACRKGRIPAEVVLVISNNAGAGALRRARKAHVPELHLSSRTHPDPAALDAALAAALHERQVDWVVLAGYLRKLGPRVLKQHQGRVLNIHPGPLPEYGGLGMYGLLVHRAVLEAGLKRTEVCIHQVDEEYDQGPVVDRRSLEVRADDTPETLQQRVQEEEHRFYPEVLKRLLEKHLGSSQAPGLVRDAPIQ